MTHQKDQNDFKQMDIKCSTGRIFSIRLVNFTNGCFISLCEEFQKIGSFYVSVANANNVSTAKVIANKLDSIFLTSVCERVALMINGFAIVNFSSNKRLNKSDMSDVLEGILKLVN